MTGIARNYRVDKIKGMAILGVVYIHLATALGVEGILNDAVMAVSRLAVPIFILYFVYFLELKCLKSQNLLGDLGRRARLLLLPYVGWSAMYMLVFYSLRDESLAKVVTRYWLGYGWSGQYYFVILFQIILFYPFLRRLSRSRLGTLSIVALVLFFCILSTYFPNALPGNIRMLGDRPVALWYPCIVAGIFAARGKIKIYGVTWLSAIIAALLLVLEYHFTSRAVSPYMKPTVMLMVLFLAGELVNTTGYALHGRIGTALSALGRNSFAVFVMNPLFIKVIVLALPVSIHAWGVFVSAIAAIFVAAMGYSASRILRFVKLGWLVGF